MPAEIFKHLKKVWVSGQQLRITRGGDEPDRGKPQSGKPPSFKPRSPAPSGFDKAKRHDAKKRPR
jgi:ATP-dependent RNA helicase DeaD